MNHPIDPAVAAAEAGRYIGQPRVTKKQRRLRRQQRRGNDGDPDAEADALSVRTFCVRHGISIPHFYKLKARGLAPVTMRAGARVLISREAAAAWRAARTDAAVSE